MADRYWVGGTASWDGTIGLKWALTSGGVGGQLAPTSADNVFFDAASGANTVTIGAGTAVCNQLTMTGFTGTIAFGTNKITIAGGGTIYTGATTFSVTGTPLIDCTLATATARTISAAATTEANSISFNISAGTGTVTINQSVKNLNFTGFTGALALSAKTIYGNLTLVSGMTLGSGASVITFAATSGTQTITSAGLTLDFPITFSGTATYQLVGATSVGTSSNRTVTLTTGTLDLNNNTFTIFGVFSSSSATNVRAISFGTSGKFVMTSSATTLWSVATVTTLTITGTNPLVEYTANASTGTRTIANSVTGGGFATAVSFNITAGTDTISNNGGTRFQNLNYTGFTGTITNDTRNIYGNLTIPSGVTLTAGANATTFVNFTSTQTITSNAQTIDFPLTINGGGGTVQLVDALTMGSTRTLTLTAGTLDLNNKTLTTGLFSSSNANTRSILFGTIGNITVNGTGTVWALTTITGFSLTGTPTVNLTDSSSTLRTIGMGAGTAAQAVSFYIKAGTGTISLITTSGAFRDIDFTGSSAIFTLGNSIALYGNLLIPSTATVGATVAGLNVVGTTGTQQITSGANVFDFNIAISGGSTIQLVDALTMGSTRTLVFTAGTLDLNNKTLTAGVVNASSSTTRAILFGTLGEINLSGASGTLWTTSNNLNLSITGTPTINATDSGSGNTRTFFQGGGVSNLAVSIYVKAGSGTVTFSTSNGVFQTIDLTGFSGTFGFTGSSMFVLGDFVLPAGTTYTATGNVLQFVGTAATQKITTNSTLIDGPIIFGRALTTNTTTGNGTTATITFTSTGYYPIVGQVITVSGVTPAGYNGTYTVTASSTTSVSYLNATTGSQTVAGTVNLATTVQLQDAFTCGPTRTFSHNSGVLDLNNRNLTIQSYTASTAAPRSILFGTANITLTGGNQNIWVNTSSSLYPSIATGTKVINCTYSGSVGARFISSVATTEANALNFNITAGSDIFSIQGSRQYNDIDFTGFNGTCVVSSASTASITMYGNWTCPASGAGAIFLSSTTPYGVTFGSGTAGKTQTLTSNGYVFDCPIAKTNSATSILLLADDLVVTNAGSSGTITLTNGVFDSGGKNITCAAFDGNNSNTKTLNISNSTITITGGGTSSGFVVAGSGSTASVTGSNIIFTTSGTTLFYGGGALATYPQITMSGTGQLLVGSGGSGNNITTLTNTTQPCTISIVATGTTAVTNFNLNGTAGNLVTFNSSVAGTARIISKTSGTVNAYYLAIQDSTATGGATWRAISSVNNGNNTGWFFDYTETVIEDSILADTPDTTASFLSDIAEPLTLADTPSVSAAFAGVITEDTTLADTQSITAAFASAITEAATLEDASIVLRTAFGDISEAITLDNDQTVVANFASIIFENFDTADSQLVVASFTAVITENTDLADVESVLASFVSSLTEALTAEDSSIAIKIFNSDIIENTTLADIQDALRTHNALISENLVPADAITVIASFTSQITENLVLLDSPILRGWFKINDTQAENWIRVNNTDANTWTSINNGQSVVWTKVDNDYP